MSLRDSREEGGDNNRINSGRSWIGLAYNILKKPDLYIPPLSSGSSDISFTDFRIPTFLDGMFVLRYNTIEQMGITSLTITQTNINMSLLRV